MSYNINAARNHAAGLDALLAVIEAAAPDVIALQEVDHGASRSGRVDQGQWLASRLGMQCAFGVAETFPDGGEFGNAILSRYPIVSTCVHALYHLDRDNDTGSAEVLAVPDFVLPYVFESRCVLGAELTVGAASIHFFATHFGLTPGQRLRQAEETADFVASWPSARAVILAGDFNAIPATPEIGLLSSRFLDAFAAQPLEVRDTRPSGAAVIRAPNGRCIDYVFLGGGVELDQASVIHDASEASDHQPIIVQVRVDP
jgi:endonuclease/exonuclease/phosphatase family metal-dependent hydrolase